jgi:parallel beta-helix repeat protein
MIIKMLQRILMAVVLVGLVSCEACNAVGLGELEVMSKDTVSVSALGHLEGDKILIVQDVDLKGTVCMIPKGKTLVFKRGTIRNGTLVGNNTQIECKKNAFDKVTIQGKWNVPEISTKLFKDLSYENALKDVVALSYPKVKNSIIIEAGYYIVKASKEPSTCISISDNTELIINGTIRLLSNDLRNYNIIAASGNSITIKGKGTIIGDKHTHTGTEGEWGMGISLKGAENTKVSGLTIKDCWGDCIYVGGDSKNVLIERCTLDHGRRQGISVTKANGVTIRNCTITNVSGTNPQYAIDIEPNRRDSVDNIQIENVIVRDCEGGLLATRGKPKDDAKTPWIGNVTIRNCQVSCKSKRPISIKRCEEVEIEKCTLYAQKGRTAISVTETGKAIVRNNTASIDGSIIEKAKNGAKQIMGKGKDPIHVKTIGQSVVMNNKIIER